VSANPWDDAEVARQQRALVDQQLERQPWPRHFSALADAVRATNCPGVVLEVGCASGYGKEILDRSGVPYARFVGLDVSTPALAIARDRWPDATWVHVDTMAGHRADIVIDGCALMHVDDWRRHLAGLCEASRRWVILHRVPIRDGTRRTTTSGYGKTFPAWEFGAADICNAMERLGFQACGSTPADGDSVTFTFAKPRQYATYADRAYLPKLRALYRSMERHCGPFELNVLAWDGGTHDAVDEWPNAYVDHADDFLRCSPRLALDQLPGPPRSRIEHYWTCGPQFIADVMEGTRQPVTYVDADVMFHSDSEPVFAEIGGAPAAVFPHNFAEAAPWPIPTRATHEQFGLYNVGLVHVADRAVAEHWAAQVRDWCYDRVEPVPIPDRRLRYGDQKYLDEWPARFGAHVVQHPGANLGPWAVHTQPLETRDGVPYFGGRPIVAYHYSGFRELPEGHTVLTRPEYCVTDEQARIIYDPYLEALKP